MIVTAVGNYEISILDFKHISAHKSSQRLMHSVACGYYISSVFTGYKWKGDCIKMFFETIVYRFRNDDIALKRVIVGPIITYKYRTYEECMKHHSGLVGDIYNGVYKIEEK